MSSQTTEKWKKDIKAQFLKELDFLSDHWVNGDDKQPFNFGGWREEVANEFVNIASQAISEAEDGVRKGFHSHYSGKPIKHPVPCNDCGSDEWVDWFLPHPVFNAVCPGGNGYLCLPCFAERMKNVFGGANITTSAITSKE